MELRVALVTGASRGIGAAIALRLAKDGFDLAINDLPSQKSALEALHKEIILLGRRSYIHIADMANDNEIKNMVDSVVENLGGLHVMVANAGIARVTLSETLGNIELWDQIMSINARGVFLCYKYAAEVMINQGKGGRIIGASSLAGKQGSEYSAAYCASKFAVRGLTQSAARELGKYDITVNAYAPGFIETPIMDTMGLDKSTIETIRNEHIKKTSLGRSGNPEEVASLVSYLASPESAYTTGQTISINGGEYFD